MADKVYGTIEKGPNTRVVVKSSTYNAKEYLHIREHYVDDAGELKPTKKGFTLSEGVQIEELISMLTVAKEDF